MWSLPTSRDRPYHVNHGEGEAGQGEETGGRGEDRGEVREERRREVLSGGQFRRGKG